MDSTDRRDFLKRVGGLAAVAVMPDLNALFPRIDSGSTLRVGVIGLGRQGKAALDQLAIIEQAEVVAICDTYARRMKAAAKRAPDATAYDTHTDLLAKAGCDAIILTTPTGTHLELATAALGAGAHVYCEAPLELTTERADALAKAADEAATVFAVGFLARANPVYNHAHHFFLSGSIDRIVATQGHRRAKGALRSYAPRPELERQLNWHLYRATSHGLAGEWASHAIDTLAWFAGTTPKSVRGSGRIALHDDGREHADTVALDFTMSDGAHFGWRGTLANSFQDEALDLLGTDGTFRLAGRHAWLFKEADAPTQGWEVYAHREQFRKEEGIVLVADATKLAAQGKLQEGIGLPHPPLWYGLYDFVGAVLDERAPACSARDGLGPTLAGIAAQRAVESGESVEF